MSKPDFADLQQAVDSGKNVYSIFDRISLGHADGKLSNLQKVRGLNPETIIRSNDSASESDRKIELSRDLSIDINKFEELRIIDENAQVDTFFYLLQKHSWRVATPFRDNEKASSVPYCDAQRVQKALEGVDEQGYILVKGDLSGIQGYIYGNIQPKRAGGLVKIAKKLRGRSIIVSLLTDFLANVILRELNLPPWHLLFAGGGHFNLLLPDTTMVRNDLKQALKLLDAQMSLHFHESLTLVVGQKEFSHEEINKNPGACFSKINVELERQKFQKHNQNLSNHFFPADDFKERTDARSKQDEWEIEIGKQFPEVNFIVEAVTNGPIFNQRKMPEVITFSMIRNTYSLLAVNTLQQADTVLADAPGLISAQIFSLNSTAFLPVKESWSGKIKSPISFGFRFVGKTLPVHAIEDRPKTFEEIAQGHGPKSDPLQLLATLRLDVDDLGFIFSKGMANATLSEIVTLSREMQYFFSTHFDHLAKKHHLYLIYSGGDDAFVVGKWDDIIAFSQELHADFREFTSGNDDVHFSAGIFMGNPHYPVGRFYRDAGNLQQAAKDSNDRKNRVSIFNHIMTWDAFSSKIDLGKTFAEALESKGSDGKSKFNTAFAYRVLQLVKSSFYERSGVDKKNGHKYKRGSVDIQRFARNIAGIRYLFARHGYDKKRADEILGKLETALIGDFLKSFDFGDDAHIKSTRDYIVALNFALFKHRSDNKPD
jgi:CRISPR-associated protein Csm1